MVKRVCCDGCGKETSHVSRLCKFCRPARTTDREWRFLVNKPRLVKAPLGPEKPRRRIREINMETRAADREWGAAWRVYLAEDDRGDSDFWKGVADHRDDGVAQGGRRGKQKPVYSRDPSEEAIAPESIDVPLPEWALRRPRQEIDGLHHKRTPRVRFLLGTTLPGWTPAHEREGAAPCPACGGIELPLLAACLGCLRSGLDPYLPLVDIPKRPSPSCASTDYHCAP